MAQVGAATFISVVLLFSGCGVQSVHPPKWLMTEAGAATLLEQALEAESADSRRSAVQRLAAGRYARHDIVVNGCATIARTDTSSSVRCAALELVADSQHDTAAAVVLDVLNADGRRAVPAGEQVRVHALHALLRLVEDDRVTQGQRDEAVETSLRLLRDDASREVRIAASRLAAEFPRRDVLDGLVAALGHADFGIVYHAERSLMRLTGVSHDHDQQAWRMWLLAAAEPFAMRGALAAELDPSPKAPWWRRAFTGFGSAKK